MNRYKLELGVFALMFFVGVMFAYKRWYQPIPESIPATSSNLLPQVKQPQARIPAEPEVPTTTQVLIQRQSTMQDTFVTGSSAPPAPRSLAELFSAMEAILQNLTELYNLLNSSPDIYRTDENLSRLYQPQIDQQQQQFTTLLQQAMTLSKPATQRFVWERFTSASVPAESYYLLLDGLRDSDNALLEQILVWLENTGIPVELRQMVAYNVLSGDAKRQVRLKGFIESRLQIEPEKSMLMTYLEVYQAMTEQGKVSKTQFREQLDRVRLRLDPEQYFDFRLKQLNLADENADYAGVLAEISTSPMTPMQRSVLFMRLSDEVISRLSSSVGGDVPEAGIAASHQQTLQRYLWAHLPTPRLQESFTVYQYSSQRFALQLLQDKAGAMDALYQRIVNSHSLDEQVALLYALPYGDGWVQKRLRYHTTLQQQLRDAANQPNISQEQRGLIESALSTLMMQPPSPDATELNQNNPETTTYESTLMGDNPTQTTSETPAPVP